LKAFPQRFLANSFNLVFSRGVQVHEAYGKGVEEEAAALILKVPFNIFS